MPSRSLCTLTASACHPAGTNSTSELPRPTPNHTRASIQRISSGILGACTHLSANTFLVCMHEDGRLPAQRTPSGIFALGRSLILPRHSAFLVSHLLHLVPFVIRLVLLVITHIPPGTQKNILHLAPWSDFDPFSTLADFLHTISPTAPMAVQITLKSGDKVKINGKNQLALFSIASYP